MMKNYHFVFVLFLAASSLLFTGCGAFALESLLGVATEEVIAANMARGIAGSVARRAMTGSLARAGVRYAAVEAGAAATGIVVADEALLNAALSSMFLAAGATLVVPLDEHTNLKAKVIDENTIQVNGQYFDVPGAIYVVATAGLNVRTGPSKDYESITVLHKNQVVFVDATTENGWARVNYGYNQSGYMKKSLLSAIR